MRDLAVQASNTGSNDIDARTAAQAEVTQLADGDRPDRQADEVRQHPAPGRHLRRHRREVRAGAAITAGSTALTTNDLG